ncbi:HAD family hydrolase [Methylobacterium indicum]|nr:HAD family phosphatase [Methylobacterium indicum]
MAETDGVDVQMRPVSLSALPAAVIFDMDGLLFDSERLSHHAMMAASEELGCGFTTEDFITLVGRPWSANRALLQERISSPDGVEMFETAWDRHLLGMRPALALKPGVIDLLAQLDTLGLPRAICTSSSRSDVDFNLELHSLDGRFQAIVAAGDYLHGKPAPDPFLRAAEVLGVKPEECLALEDSHNGVRSAAAAGMCTVMVPDLLPATDEMRRLCRCIVPDLHDVRRMLG